MQTKYELRIFADYFQFYLQDEDASEQDDGDWKEPGAIERLLVVGRGIIRVGTARNMTVPVTIEICDAKPDLSFDEWDQVNECSLEIPSGSLVVAGCTDYFPDALRIKVEPATYRARIFYGKLNSLRENDLEGDDHYSIFLWKEKSGPLVVFKQRQITDG